MNAVHRTGWASRAATPEIGRPIRIALRLCIGLLVAGTAAGMAHAADLRTDATAGQTTALTAHDEGGLLRLYLPKPSVPKIGPDATQLEYVRWAKQSMSMGNDTEAELSLEWAQYRGRIAAMYAAAQQNRIADTYDRFCERPLCIAMKSIGFRKRDEAYRAIDLAIANIEKFDVESVPAPETPSGFSVTAQVSTIGQASASK